MSNINICPSILSANFACLMDDVVRLEKAGVDILHVDVMDGHFVPNISFGVPVLNSLSNACNMFMDVHLMITNPMKYVKSFVDAGADSITFHVECDDDVDACIKYIHDLNCRCGIAIKPGTDIDFILPYIGVVDMILVMTVEPGFGGQSFMPDMLKKVRKIRNLDFDIDIQVDGGINCESARCAVDAGANFLVAGSAIFREKNFEKAVKRLKDANIS